MQHSGVLMSNSKQVFDSIKDVLILKFPFSFLNVLGSNCELLHLTYLKDLCYPETDLVFN